MPQRCTTATACLRLECGTVEGSEVAKRPGFPGLLSSASMLDVRIGQGPEALAAFKASRHSDVVATRAGAGRGRAGRSFGFGMGMSPSR